MRVFQSELLGALRLAGFGIKLDLLETSNRLFRRLEEIHRERNSQYGKVPEQAR